jgi:hypothetical protein
MATKSMQKKKKNPAYDFMNIEVNWYIISFNFLLDVYHFILLQNFLNNKLSSN